MREGKWRGKEGETPPPSHIPGSGSIMWTKIDSDANH